MALEKKEKGKKKKKDLWYDVVKPGLKGAGEALGVGQDKEKWEATKKKRKKEGKWYAGKGVGEFVKSIKTTSEATKKRVAKKKAAKAKKKEGKTWTKAVKKQKKAGGPTMNELIKQRNAAEKGSEAYTKAQNQINKAYGSKKVHKATKKDAETKLTSKEKSRTSVDEYGVKSSAESGQSEERQKAAKGGLVESNPYGWPTRDSSDHS